MRPEKALELSLDAVAFGREEAARKNAVNERTIRRANQEVRENPALAAVAQAKREQIEERLQTQRLDYLEFALAKMKEKADGADLREVAGSYKVVSEHNEVAKAMKIREQVNALSSGERNDGPKQAGGSEQTGETDPTEGGLYVVHATGTS